jgi:hypothetical protein
MVEPSMSVNTNVTVPDGCATTDESSAANDRGTTSDFDVTYDPGA